MCCAKGDRYLRMAKEQNPQEGLPRRVVRPFEINWHRTLHGALLDAELLADVYLATTRGQESPMMALDDEAGRLGDETASAALSSGRRQNIASDELGTAGTRRAGRNRQVQQGTVPGWRRSRLRQPRALKAARRVATSAIASEAVSPGDLMCRRG